MESQLRHYRQIEEAGMLVIEYDGGKLDMNAIAVLQLNLQAIAEKVVASMPGVEPVEPRRTVYSPGIEGRFTYTLNPIIRLVPDEIRVGSLFEYVIPYFSYLSDPDIRAALQGVLGNIIFAIGSSAFARYYRVKTSGEEPPASAPSIDVGPNVAAIAVALAQHGPQSLKIKHKAADGSEFEVEITP